MFMHKHWPTATLLWIALATPLAAQDNGDTNDLELKPDTVLVTRGEARVTVRDFEAFLDTIPEEHRTQVANHPERIAELLENLAKNRLLALKAKEAGLDENPEVAAEVRLAGERVLARTQMRHVTRNVEPAEYEQQAKEYYLTNRDKFRAPDRVTVTHLLISSEERDKEAARALAEEVAANARGGDTPFQELVAEYTEDPGFDKNQGRYTVERNGRMVKPFEEAAFGLESPGEIAGPVETRFGYHLIRLESREEERHRPFDEVKAQLIKQMRERHLARARQDYLNQLMLDNELKAEREVISALRERYRARDASSQPDTDGEQ